VSGSVWRQNFKIPGVVIQERGNCGTTAETKPLRGGAKTQKVKRETRFRQKKESVAARRSGGGDIAGGWILRKIPQGRNGRRMP